MKSAFSEVQYIYEQETVRVYTQVNKNSEFFCNTKIKILIIS